MNNIGLKYFWKEHKGDGLKCILYDLKLELKYAFKRAWLGYDDVDVFSYFSRFTTRTILVLEKLKETHVGVWWVPEESEHYNDLGSEDELTGCRVFSEEETDVIIETMIWHLKMTDDDFVEKQLYGNNVYDDDYRMKNKDEFVRIGHVMEQNKDAFMKLFKMFFYDLWD